MEAIFVDLDDMEDMRRVVRNLELRMTLLREYAAIRKMKEKYKPGKMAFTPTKLIADIRLTQKGNYLFGETLLAFRGITLADLVAMNIEDLIKNVILPMKTRRQTHEFLWRVYGIEMQCNQIDAMNLFKSIAHFDPLISVASI